MWFSAIFLVSVLIVLEVNSLPKSNQDKDDGINDRWIWGYVDITTPPNKVQKSHIRDTPARERLQIGDQPCLQKLPPLPNYRAPGKRIAEQKCEEYIWQVNNRADEKKLNEACTEYRKNQGDFIGILEVGGRNVMPGEFPHMGAIGWKAVTGTWVFKCGSFLISSKFVLTAAHCTKADSRDTEIADVVPKVIRFGDKNIKDRIDDDENSPITGKISRIIVHPEYKSPKKYNDIALMELDRDLIFNKNVQPACLWHQFSTKPLGTKATSTGWGVVHASSRETSPVLQVIDIDIIDSQTCDKLLRPNCNRLWCGIQDTQICAGNLSGGVDSCKGDSGGPLQVKIPLPLNVEGAMHYVIGITSFGFGCAFENTPGVYTRVSPFLDWIESHVWK